MRYILTSSARFACPSCGSSHLARSQRKGIYEHLLLSVFQVKPYRCLSCDYRHYRYRPSATQGGHAVPSAPE